MTASPLGLFALHFPPLAARLPLPASRPPGSVTWWCSATGLPWTWQWQWYPGVHLLLLLTAAAWLLMGRVQHWAHRPWGYFGGAWFLFLATLDWPIGKLGAGYLASVHTLQFLLLTVGVAPLVLKSVPPDGWRRMAPPGSWQHEVLRKIAAALPAVLVYNAIVLLSHFPTVVDGVMTTQLGSFALDLSWLVAGLFLWWPILAPPEFVSLGVFGTLVYIFGATLLPTIPAMMMVFSTWPIYRLYELAPRVLPHFTANDDIKLAGLVMKLIGEIPLWIAMIVVFFRGTAVDGEMINA